MEPRTSPKPLSVAFVSLGCAKNLGLIKALEEKLHISVRRLPEDPQIVGAIGAALIASERLDKST